MGENFRLAKQIAQQASRQHGNITRAQLVDLGLDGAAITRRVHAGLLHRVHTGVYAVGRPAKLPLERAAAAVLACGPGAALSHTSALTLWGLAKTWTFPLHVTIPNGDRRPKGLTVHRSHTLARKDVRTTQSIWATSPARTILDCAPDLTDKRLTRLVNDARRGLLTLEALAELTARNPRHPGTTHLRALHLAPGGPTRSGFEDDFTPWCRQHHLPTPVMDVKVCGLEVDAYFPEHGVIVELDSWDYHQSRDAFENDRHRDRITTAAGLTTVRLTELTDQAADQLRTVLGLRRRRAG